MIDLNIKQHEVEDERRKALVEMDLLKGELRESENKLKEMNEKSYFKKLLGL